jgi:hypothetical protein
MKRRKNVNWVNVLGGGLMLAALTTYINDEPAVAKDYLVPTANPTAAKKNKPKNSHSSPATARKPLKKGEVREDKPLPAEDITAKPHPGASKPSVVKGGLSESQIKAMKAMLEDAKKDADAERLDEAIGKYNEFAAGPWEEIEKELKTRAADKHSAIEAAIKIADEASKAKDKAKFTKALTDLLAAVEKAK